MTVDDVYKWLDHIAPFETQDEYDNAGLVAGNPDTDVHRVLFALDATKAVASEAKRIGASLMITHHPLMFSPIQQLHYQSGEGKVLTLLAGAGISLIAAHTNLDICPGGVADSLAKALALQQVTQSVSCPYMRTGFLAKQGTAKEVLAMVCSRLPAAARMYGDPKTPVRSVAVIPGAGGSEYMHVNADVLITGEIKHHELLAALDRGLIIIDAGHYATEFPGIEALHERFCKHAAANGWAVDTKLYTQPPFVQTANEYPAL